MNYPHRLSIALIASFCLIGAPLGCSSSAPKPDPTPKTTQSALPTNGEPAGDIFERYAPYMPDDTAIVAIMRTDLASDFVQDLFDSPDDAEKSRARVDAMRADFRKLFLKNFGVDPLSADFGLLVGGPTLQFIVLDGNIETAFTTQERLEVNGYTAHYVTDVPDDPDAGVWVTALSGTDGFAVFENQPSFERFAKAGSDGSGKFEESTLAQLYRELFANTQVAPFSGAVVLDSDTKQEIESELEFAAPEAFSFYIGDALHVELRGEEAALEELQESVEELRKEALSAVTDLYQNRQNEEPTEASIYIFGYHLMQHFNDNLSVTRASDSLAYELTLPRRFLALSMVTGAISTPAFLKYIKRSKMAEATYSLGQMEQSALQYYRESGADGTCSFPPAIFSITLEGAPNDAGECEATAHPILESQEVTSESPQMTPEVMF